MYSMCVAVCVMSAHMKGSTTGWSEEVVAMLSHPAFISLNVCVLYLFWVHVTLNIYLMSVLCLGRLT